MKLWRKLLARFAPHVAKPPERPDPLIAEAQAVRRDLRELRRFEIIVRKR